MDELDKIEADKIEADIIWLQKEFNARRKEIEENKRRLKDLKDQISQMRLDVINTQTTLENLTGEVFGSYHLDLLFETE